MGSKAPLVEPSGRPSVKHTYTLDQPSRYDLAATGGPPPEIHAPGGSARGGGPGGAVRDPRGNLPGAGGSHHPTTVMVAPHQYPHHGGVGGGSGGMLGRGNQTSSQQSLREPLLPVVRFWPPLGAFSLLSGVL